MRVRVDLEMGWIEYDPVARPVRIGDRLFPPSVDVVFPGAPDQPRLSMHLSVIGGFPQCRTLTIEAKDGVREVRTTDLRAVPIDSWVEQLYGLVASVVVSEGDRETASVITSDPAARRQTEKQIQQARTASRRKITNDLLREVAAVYRANVDERPVEAVRAAFGVSYRSAAGYVERARAAGHLPATTPGKRRA